MRILVSRVTAWMRGTMMIAFMALAVAGCGTEPEESFQGILMTFENGMTAGTIGDASDDWRPLPGGCVTFGPAFPNPATAETHVVFSLCRSETVECYLESAPGRTAKTLLTKSMLNAGEHQISIDVTDFQPGIYRAWILVHTSNGIQRSYGDIKVERR